MNKLIVATLAAVVVAATASSAFAFFPPIKGPKLIVPRQDVTHDLTCRVSGDNLYITNFGNSTDDSGREVVWASPATGDQGSLILPPIAPGDEVLFAGVLTDFAGPGSPCDVGFA